MKRYTKASGEIIKAEDGFRYVLLSYDIMSNKGERYYTTVDLRMKLSPEIINGELEWVLKVDDIQKAIIEKCPSVAKRKDFVALPVLQHN